MKKTFYIVCFAILGLLIATLLHVIIEMPLLLLITYSFETYSNTFWWQNWDNLHHFGGLIIWSIGLILGVWAGFHYWRIIYIEKRYGTPKI